MVLVWYRYGAGMVLVLVLDWYGVVIGNGILLVLIFYWYSIGIVLMWRCYVIGLVLDWYGIGVVLA